MSKQKLFIVGVCGTFMSGIASLAYKMDYELYGCDKDFYPPFNQQLNQISIKLFQGFEVPELNNIRDCTFVIGNIAKRGMPIVEYILQHKLNYYSGPEWLYHNVLKTHDKVVCVSGTHGKTTTTSLLAWLMKDLGYSPSYLIGGVPRNFESSAYLSSKRKFFVLEGDEYDSAFFDKRSKFVSYRPDYLIINHLEMDHMDIFDSIKDIEKQFHHLIRTIPRDGKIFYRSGIKAIEDLLKLGYWCDIESFGDTNLSDWQIDNTSNTLRYKNLCYEFRFKDFQPSYNYLNYLTAIAMVHELTGHIVEEIIQSSYKFLGVARRSELKAEYKGIKIYDDFAHHPTAITETIKSYKQLAKTNAASLHIVLDFGSNSLVSGAHDKSMQEVIHNLDNYYLYSEKVDLKPKFLHNCYQSKQRLIEAIASNLKTNDIVVFMSNSKLQNCHEDILKLIQ